MTKPLLIRAETPGDYDDIRRVVAAAFGQVQEADLVDSLRKDGALALSLVAVKSGAICGHVALSFLRSPPRAAALAPVSVVPEMQRRGIGAALVKATLTQASDLGVDIVFVLGDPEYYRRFGFSAETASSFACRYAGPYFMALPLVVDSAKGGEIEYADAFAALG